MFSKCIHHELHCHAAWINILTQKVCTVKQKMFQWGFYSFCPCEMVLWRQEETVFAQIYRVLSTCNYRPVCEFHFLCDFPWVFSQKQSPGFKMSVLLMTSTSVVRRHEGCMRTVACRRTLCRCHSSRQSRASGKLAVSNLFANMLSFSISHGKSPIP